MRLALFWLAAAASAQTVAPVDPALAAIAATHRFLEAAISPDGAHVAYVEGAGCAQSIGYLHRSAHAHYRRGRQDHARRARPSPGRPTASRSRSSPTARRRINSSFTWHPADGGPARQLTHLKGLLAEPRWSPDGKRIAILFTENLPHAAGPLDPVPPDSGVLESQIFEQRLAVVDAAAGAVRQLSPKDIYIYEYDWSPDGRSFAATAARRRRRRQLVDRAALYHLRRERRHEVASTSRRWSSRSRRRAGRPTASRSSSSAA